MEITAGRVCQMMSKGALLAAGQQRKAFEVSNLKINLLGVGKKKQNPQAGRTQVTAALMAGTQHRLWRAAPVLCPGCGTYREPLQHGTTTSHHDMSLDQHCSPCAGPLSFCTSIMGTDLQAWKHLLNPTTGEQRQLPPGLPGAETEFHSSSQHPWGPECAQRPRFGTGSV